MIRPDKGKYPVTQGFGANPWKYGYGPAGHDGIDLGSPIGQPLYSPRSGKVVMAQDNKTYGKRIKIDNGKNYDYVGHLSKFEVFVGQQVKEGELIAYSGATGDITGPHTHWGVYTYDNKPINPQVELDNNKNKEEDMVANDDDIKRAYRFIGRPPTEKEIRNRISEGQTAGFVMQDLAESPEGLAFAKEVAKLPEYKRYIKDVEKRLDDALNGLKDSYEPYTGKQLYTKK